MNVSARTVFNYFLRCWVSGCVGSYVCTFCHVINKIVSVVYIRLIVDQKMQEI
jgi:hypothetical protein